MRIVCISDTHNQLVRFSVPEGDVLIHAGDLTQRGTSAEIFDQFGLLAAMPHQTIIFTPGNHDWGFQTQPGLRDAVAARFPRVTILIDESAMVGGMRLYASPFQPYFNNWAFQFAAGPEGTAEAEQKWAQIPDDTVMLVTHGPASGTLDRTLRQQNAGCVALKSRIAQLSTLRFHVFGHVHEDYGTAQIGNVVSVNASTCDAHYRAVQPPIVVNFESEHFVAI